MNFEGETLDFVEALARSAGPLLLEGLRTVPTVTEKASATDVTTETDLAIQKHIVDGIHARFPDDGIVAEENVSLTGTSGRCWFVDPLDGTSNFVRGLWPSVISIAVESDHNLVCGVVYDPVLDELFSASIGNGASLNGVPIAQRNKSVVLAEAFVGLSGTDAGPTPNFRADLMRRLATESDSVRDIGSTALAICYAAVGRFDAHIVVGVHDWDVAAGLVIAREAGCDVEGFTEGSKASAKEAIISVPSLLAELRKVMP